MDFLNINNQLVAHKIIHVSGDGACLFRSFSVLMYGTENYHQNIRKAIVNYVSHNWEEFKIISNDEYGNNYSSKMEYSRDMLKCSTYGTYCEIVAAGRIYNFKFEVFRDTELYMSSGSDKAPVKRLRFIGPLENGHFDAYKMDSISAFSIDTRVARDKKQQNVLELSELSSIPDETSQLLHSASIPLSRAFSSSFGVPCVLNEQVLPTKKDVLLRVLLCYNESYGIDKKKLHLNTFGRQVSNEVEKIWKTTRIPIITSNSIYIKIQRLIDLYHKNIKLSKTTESFSKFNDQMSKQLFDIAYCKCVNNKCKCPLHQQIPSPCLSFLLDQRGQRQQIIQNTLNDHITSSDQKSVSDFDDEHLSSSNEFNPDKSSSSLEIVAKTGKQCRVNLKNFVIECDSYVWSVRQSCSSFSIFNFSGSLVYWMMMARL